MNSSNDPRFLVRTGQKRKRSDNDKKVSQQAPHGPQPPFEDLLRGKIHHGVKEVKSTAKKAKDFEIRRAIKRLRNTRNRPSRSSDDSVSNLEKEMELLKKLDHEAVALVALRTKLKKDHVSQNSSFQTALQIALPRPSSPSPLKGSPDDLMAARKVESRLLSSKVLADGIKSVLDSLHALVESSAAAPDVETDDESEFKAEETLSGREAADMGSKARGKNASVAEWEPNGSGRVLPPFSSDEGDREGENVESDNELEDDDDADAASWESGSVASFSGVLHPSKRHKGPPISDSNSKESTDSGSESEEGIDPDALEDMDSGEEAHGNGPSGSNRFLPSLQVGFTRGDSDTESWKGQDDDAAGDKKRKNRRGQRARQAIWEKKYGRHAKHVKKQREEEKSLAEAKALAAKARAAQWATAMPTRLDGGWKGGPENRNAAMRKNIGGTSAHVGKGACAAAASEKLHPSWEAKRKLKEKEQIGIIPSQGKKIKF